MVTIDKIKPKEIKSMEHYYAWKLLICIVKKPIHMSSCFTDLHLLHDYFFFVIVNILSKSRTFSFI